MCSRNSSKYSSNFMSERDTYQPIVRDGYKNLNNAYDFSTYSYNPDTNTYTQRDFVKTPNFNAFQERSLSVVENFSTPELTRISKNMLNSSGSLVSPKTPTTFVMVQSNGCGHCKRAKPDFEKLNQLFQSDPNVTIATVVADEDRDAYAILSKAFNLQGVPSYLLFRGPMMVGQYNGNRSTSDMKDFIIKSVNLVENFEQDSGVARLTKEMLTPNGNLARPKTPTTFVMVQSNGCGHCKRAKPDFEKLNQLFQSDPSVTIATVVADEDRDAYAILSKAFNLQGVPSYLLFRGPMMVGQYNGNRSTSDMKDFIVKSVNLVENFEQDSGVTRLTKEMLTASGDLVNPRTPLTFVMVQSNGCGHCKMAKPEFEKLAKVLKTHPKITVATVVADEDNQAFDILSRAFNLRGVPAYLLFKGPKMVNQYNGGRSFGSMMDFVTKSI